MKQFLIALAPDGGFGYRYAEDSTLGILLYGTNEEYNIAKAAMILCGDLMEKPLHLCKVFDYAWDHMTRLTDGSYSAPIVNIKVTLKFLLGLIPSDVSDPMKILREEVHSIRNFLNVLKHMKNVMIFGSPDPAAMLQFIENFTYLLLQFFRRNPLKTDIFILDLEELKKDKSFEIINEKIKKMKDV